MKAKLNDIQRLNKGNIFKKKSHWTRCGQYNCKRLSGGKNSEVRLLLKVSLNYYSTFFFFDKKQNWKPQLYGCSLYMKNKAKFQSFDT